MADKFINELPVASLLTDAGLLVVYQDEKTQSIRGELIKQYAAQGVSQYVEEAKTAAQTAGDAAGEAQAAAEEAKGVALYPPQVNPETGMWQTWDAAQQQYVDTDQKAEGPEGPAGSSIQSIERTSGTGAPGTTDTYTVTLTNGSTTTFQVYNGADGAGTGDFKADGSVPMTGVLQMAGHTISGLPAPVSDSDPVRKQDVPTLAADRQLSNLDTPQAALANLGAAVRPSLAINGDFRHPVNQRGKTVYTEAGPCIDMCTLDPTTGAVKLEILDGFIRLTQTNPGATRDQAMSIAIPKENFYPGETVTVSALVRGTGNTQILCLANNNIVPESLVFKENTPDWDIITSTFSLPDDLGDSPVRIYMYADTSGANGYTDFMAAKPEEGSPQTLAYKKSDGTWELLPQPENDYATQLLKCQWHKMVMGNETGYSPIGVGQARSESLVVISVPTPTTLRIRPTVVLDGQVNVRNAETAVTSTEVSVDVEGSNCVLLNAVVTGAVTGAAYDAFLPPGSFLILDCSL